MRVVDGSYIAFYHFIIELKRFRGGTELSRLYLDDQQPSFWMDSDYYTSTPSPPLPDARARCCRSADNIDNVLVLFCCTQM